MLILASIKYIHVPVSTCTHETNELTALVVFSAWVTMVAELGPLSSSNEGENLLIRGCLWLMLVMLSTPLLVSSTFSTSASAITLKNRDSCCKKRIDKLRLPFSCHNHSAYIVQLSKMFTSCTYASCQLKFKSHFAFCLHGLLGPVLWVTMLQLVTKSRTHIYMGQLTLLLYRVHVASMQSQNNYAHHTPCP